MKDIGLSFYNKSSPGFGIFDTILTLRRYSLIVSFRINLLLRILISRINNINGNNLFPCTESVEMMDEYSVWRLSPLGDETGESGNRRTFRSGRGGTVIRPRKNKDDNPDTEMTEAPVNEEIKKDKGKGKRTYESDDEQEDLSENLKKPKDGEYRDTNEQYGSSDDSSGDEVIENKNILIFRRPDVIDDEREEISKRLHLIEKAKILDSRLPSEAQ